MNVLPAPYVPPSESVEQLNGEKQPFYRSRNRKRYLLTAAGVVAVIVVALGLGLGIYYGIRSRHSSSTSANANPASTSSTTTSPTATSTTGSSSSATATDEPSNKGESLEGPLLSEDFPDPCWIEVNNTYHAFATNANQKNVQVATSQDFKNWTYTGKDALPEVGNWSTGANVWAPDVVQVDDGSFVLYYTASHINETGRHCVNAATSKKVEGPYTPVNVNDTALICPLKRGGAIDPEGFKDADGKRYLIYKVDGNSLDTATDPLNPTPIMLQEVEKDGYTKVGAPRQLLDRTDQDGPLIEAPSLVRHQDGDDILYILFYSSNNFATPNYDVSYATSKNLTGPYKRSESRLLRSGDPNQQLDGPGGLDAGVNGSKVVFHSTKQGPNAKGGLVRQMWTGEIKIHGTIVTI